MVIIRPAFESDLGKISEMAILCFPQDFVDDLGQENTPRNALEWVKEDYGRKRFAKYHVAEESGLVLGYVFHEMMGGLSGNIELKQIGVHPDYQRLGIGKRLILESEKNWKDYLQEAFGKKPYKMLLTTSEINDNAHNLYAACGFKPEMKIKNFYFGSNEEIWIKEL
jgi:ribosomal protein S18 acetylase RimI-like enzyme